MNFPKTEELVLYHLKSAPPEVIPQKIQMLFSHPGRQASYYATRKALKLALLKQGISVLDWEDLQINKHHHLEKYPDVLVSLSDTEKIGCAFIASEKLHRSIGVDIELCDRKMKDSVLKFFINADDKYSDPLQLWTQKEAAFKAISPFCHEQELNLKMIAVKDHTFVLKGSPDLTGTLSIEKVLFENKELWVTKAYLPLTL